MRASLFQRSSVLSSFSLCALWLAFSFCAEAQTAAPSAHVLAQKVDAHYNHLASLEARYSEHYTGMGLDRTETGTLLLKKPGRMRWSYDQPTGKVFILDGKFAWFYTPGDAQAQKIPAKQLDDLRSPLRFLLGHTQLEKELTGLAVSVNSKTNTGILSGEAAHNDGGVNYQLSGVPHGMEQRIRSLTLTVLGDGTILGMRLEEIDGSVTEFTFTGMKENIPVKDADFNFTPPDGVEVVNGLSPI